MDTESESSVKISNIPLEANWFPAEKSGRGDRNGPCPQLATEAMKGMARGPETRPAAH